LDEGLGSGAVVPAAGTLAEGRSPLSGVSAGALAMRLPNASIALE